MAFESGQMGRKRPGRMKVSMFSKLMSQRTPVKGKPSKVKSHNVKGGQKKGPSKVSSSGIDNLLYDPKNIKLSKSKKRR